MCFDLLKFILKNLCSVSQGLLYFKFMVNSFNLLFLYLVSFISEISSLISVVTNYHSFEGIKVAFGSVMLYYIFGTLLGEGIKRGPFVVPTGNKRQRPLKGPYTGYGRLRGGGD